MYFTHSHIQGMLLAFGIIYKAWLLCGALSRCLLPLLPMTLPGPPSAFPNAPSANPPSNRRTELGIKNKSKHPPLPVPATSFPERIAFFAPLEKDAFLSFFLFVFFFLVAVIIRGDKHNPNTSEKVTQTHPIWP